MCLPPCSGFNSRSAGSHQLGYGIEAGVEAAIHASRVYLAHLPSNKALVKVDFQNAFNSIHRDKLLEAVKGCMPYLLHYVHSAYSGPSVLLWDGVQLISAEDFQQPLRSHVVLLRDS